MRGLLLLVRILNDLPPALGVLNQWRGVHEGLRRHGGHHLAVPVQVNRSVAIQVQEHRVIPCLVNEPFLCVVDTLLQDCGLHLVGVELIANQIAKGMIHVDVGRVNCVHWLELAVGFGDIIVFLLDHSLSRLLVLILLLLFAILLKGGGLVELVVLC